ncbi:hypothetical protein COCMIDRAFT_109711 [Bipolaris oryzae ATCC 44560]|uniref:Uncharacterized protein n=1 Tax=Bipolaris oryzae ATCC 44560 TaxID=930090 RepID=W6YR15_COCMI|nr:uncharacterized protein COCMIDRAFT_109711 [Bipolaris oryzae ATCC 44560]EUC40075.1 hypothetical protein COCMIDRAFT_109711 [Bipolaris oryzae ATCC 44560]
MKSTRIFHSLHRADLAKRYKNTTPRECVTVPDTPCTYLSFSTACFLIVSIAHLITNPLKSYHVKF